jgi:integrase
MQAKNTAPKPLVSVYAEKGVLAFRFSSKYNSLFEILDGKAPTKQRTMGLGLRESPENWKLAQSAALRIERDLSDSESWQILFDPTFVKYGLAVKYTSAALQLAAPIPEVEPEITVGAMWEEYLIWKKTTIEETTFKARYSTTYTHIVYGRQYKARTSLLTLSDYPLAPLYLDDKQGITTALDAITAKAKVLCLRALNEAFDYAKTKGLLVNPTTENPFTADKFSVPAVTTQQKYADKVVNGETVAWHETEDENTLENDRRAFTKVERDIIIKAFYESDKAKTRKGSIMVAPLIEFLFLTGCRPSEVYALRWCDVDLDRGLIKITKSLGGCTGTLKKTKTGESRLFYFSDVSRLKALLLEIKSDKAEGLIFSNSKGKHITGNALSKVWCRSTNKNTLKSGKQVEYVTLGAVTKLVRDGLINGYLSPYHCRHTYITLTAQANSHNTDALLHIATSCGNSVDVILRHYLGRVDATQLVEV